MFVILVIFQWIQHNAFRIDFTCSIILLSLKFQFPLMDAVHCGTEIEHQVFNGSLIRLFPYSSCLLLHEYWNLVPNNNNTQVKETKIWLPFKTQCSLSDPRCTAYHKGNCNS